MREEVRLLVCGSTQDLRDALEAGQQQDWRVRHPEDIEAALREIRSGWANCVLFDQGWEPEWYDKVAGESRDAGLVPIVVRPGHSGPCEGRAGAGETFLQLYLSDPACPTQLREVVDAALRAAVLCRQARLAETYLPNLKRLECLGLLVGGVAHDLNNMFSAVLAQLELLALDLAETPRDELRLLQGVESVKSATVRASAITRRLTQYVREDTEPEPADLTPAVSRVGSIFRRVLPDGIEFDTACVSDPWKARVSLVEIEQILIHLIGNAVDAMGDGGRLRVRVRNLEPRAWRRPEEPDENGGRWVAVSVEDTGVGIPQADQKRIFEPFCTTRSSRQGAGLGLAKVRELVERNHGEILVESRVGKGSRFEVRFPALEPRQKERSISTQGGCRVVSPTARYRKTIVLCEVDDPPGVGSSRGLRKMGFRVFTSQTAGQTRQMVQTCPGHVDLILLDLDLPDGSGPEVADELLRDRPWMRVIYVSARNQEDLAAQGFDFSGKEFLQKPYTLAELASRIEHRLLVRKRGLAKRILMVEDHQVNRLHVSQFLTRHGYHVEAVNNGRRALDRFSQGRFDLVLMDIQMPETDGLEAAQRIREFHLHDPDSRCPIIFVTAFPECREQCIACGGDAVIAKPFDPNALLREIDSLIHCPHDGSLAGQGRRGW